MSAPAIRVVSPATGELLAEVADEGAASRRACGGAEELARRGSRRGRVRRRHARRRERQAAARGGGHRDPLPVRAHPVRLPGRAAGPLRGNPEPVALPHEEDAPDEDAPRSRRRDRPVELPDPEQRGRLRGAAPHGQYGRLEAVGSHAAHLAPAARSVGQGGEPAGPFPGRDRARRSGRGAREPRRRDHVHLLGRDRPEGRVAGGGAPHSLRGGARPQVTLRRPRRRRSRARRRGRGLVELRSFP
jgi:hypothetical protein